MFLSQAVAKVMKEHGGGKIINVASMDGYRHETHGGTYAISKAGVIMATRIMAQEWAQYNIRVNAIAPGHVHTRLGDSIFAAVPGYEEELLQRVPMGRIGEPEEIVGASFVAGDTLVADGGTLLTQATAANTMRDGSKRRFRLS